MKRWNARMPRLHRLRLPGALLAALLVSAGTPTAALDAGEAALPGLQPAPAAPKDGPRLKVFVTDMLGWGEIANLTLRPGDAVPLTLMLENAEGIGIRDQELVVTSTAGNSIDITRPVTSGEGRADILIVAEKAGPDSIVVKSPQAVATIALMVQDSVDGQSHAFGAVPLGAELPQVEGAVSWDTLAEVEVEEREDGLFTPRFAEAVKALHGTEVKIQGFMLPLDNAERQKHFVLSASPPSCFFCLPGGPESMVEITADEGLAFTFEPILVEGRLEVLEDHELGLFYRVRDAAVQRLGR